VKIAALFAIMAVVLTACPSQSELDKVMGRAVEGAPVTQEQRIDCDLIFPGPDHR
jgi:hypothetical protein